MYVCNIGFRGVDVARVLVRGFPASTLERDNHGDLPLLAALRSAAPPSIVQVLVEERPETLRKADYDGNMPGHVAVLDESPTSSRRSVRESTANRMSSARFLVEQWPTSLRIRGDHGRVVLHLAVRWCARTLGVRLDRRGGDDDARAARSNWLRFLEFLVRQWPGALHVRDASRGLPPLLHAAAARDGNDDDDDDYNDNDDVAPLDAVYLLLRARPEQLLLSFANRGAHRVREDRKTARQDES